MIERSLTRKLLLPIAVAFTCLAVGGAGAAAQTGGAAAQTGGASYVAQTPASTPAPASSTPAPAKRATLLANGKVVPPRPLRRRASSA
jgi:hypothetical protein